MTGAHVEEALGAVGRTLYAPTVPLTPVLDRSALDSKNGVSSRRGAAQRTPHARAASSRRVRSPFVSHRRSLARPGGRYSTHRAPRRPERSRSVVDAPSTAPGFPPRSVVAGTRSRSDTRTIAPRRGVSRELKRERDGWREMAGACLLVVRGFAAGARDSPSDVTSASARPSPRPVRRTSDLSAPSPSLPQPLPSASRCCCTSGSCGTSSFGSSPSS